MFYLPDWSCCAWNRPCTFLLRDHSLRRWFLYLESSPPDVATTHALPSSSLCLNCHLLSGAFPDHLVLNCTPPATLTHCRHFLVFLPCFIFLHSTDHFLIGYAFYSFSCFSARMRDEDRISVCFVPCFFPCLKQAWNISGAQRVIVE